MNEFRKRRLIAEDVEENRKYAALSYIGILFLLTMIMRPKSRFCHFHVRQGIILFIFEVLFLSLGQLPKVGWIFLFLFSFPCVLLIIWGAANALAGLREEVPVIGKYARLIKI